MNRLPIVYEALVGIAWGVALLILSTIVLDGEWSLQAGLLLILYAWLFIDRQLLRRRHCQRLHENRQGEANGVRGGSEVGSHRNP
jgi:hypothetical protein